MWLKEETRKGEEAQGEGRGNTGGEKGHAEITERIRDKTVNAIENEHTKRRETVRQAMKEVND